MKIYALACIGIVLCLGASPALAAAQPAKPNPAQDVSGVWWTTSYSAKILPVGGGELPFTPAGLAAYRRNMAGLKDGTLPDTARKFCVPDGVPRILATPYPFQIFQSPGYVTIVYEVNHVFRTIPMDIPVPSDEALEIFPYFSGNSFGHWEGDTLVVVTKGFNEKTFLDATGVPHTDQMHVTERLRRINGRKELEDIATIEDPATFTKPWSVRYVYALRPDIVIDTSYTCGEPHRDLSSVKGAPK